MRYHEAFKRGLFDVRTENDPARWQTGYDFPALRDGRVVKEAFPTGLPKASFYFVFNTRRPVFADIRVREAIAMLFDFEWVNHNLFFDLYRRTASYFEGSELSAHGRPADARERALLAPFPDAVRADVLDGTWSPPVSDGSGRDRAILRRALALLAAAGYELRGTELRRARSRPAVHLRDHGRSTATRSGSRSLFAGELKRAGIAAQRAPGRRGAIRGAAHRLRFRHDPEPLGPVAVARQRAGLLLELGRRRRQRHAATTWASRARRSTRMIAALLKAQSARDFVAAVRALDRVLISGFYIVPLFHLPEQWVARWTDDRASGGDVADAAISRKPGGASREVRRTVILGDPARTDAAIATGIGGRATLDDLFRRAATRRPDALALIDPPNRDALHRRPPRRLTYAQADRMISAIAGRLRRIGLRTDAIVGLQIRQHRRKRARAARRAARRADRDAAAAVVAARRGGGGAQPRRRQRADRERARRRGRSCRRSRCRSRPRPSRSASSAASARNAARRRDRARRSLRRRDARSLPAAEARARDRPGPGAHLAVITWDVVAGRRGAGRAQPCRADRRRARGRCSKASIEQDAVILSTLTMSSFAGLASALVPWLMVGGTLALHHPFDAAVLRGAAQRHELRHHHPARVRWWRRSPRPGIWSPATASSAWSASGARPNGCRARRLAQGRARDDRRTGVRRDRLDRGAARRRTDRPAEIPFGLLPAPRGTKGAVIVGEVQRGANGTVALRGPMVPHGAFPPGAERTQFPHVKITPQAAWSTPAIPVRAPKLYPP